jgi:hypothetical protein
VAGYNPVALKNFLARVKNFEPEDATYKNKEHPMHMVRLEKIDQTLKTNGLTQNLNATMKGRFNEHINP